jgi:hypothetical protein
MAKAGNHFTYLPKYRVALCRTCHYCVWPDNGRTHLREKHGRPPSAERALVSDELCAYPGVLHFDEDFELSQTVDRPIPGLRLFKDGRQCRLGPEKCTFICGPVGGLKKHWREVYKWSVTGKWGGSRAATRCNLSCKGKQTNGKASIASASSTWGVTQATSQSSMTIKLDGAIAHGAKA